MQKPAITTLAVIALAAATAATLAQHAPGGHGAAPADDSRELVKMPPMMVAHIFSNMRDHLLAIQEIQQALGAGKLDEAAKVAEQRLGMSALTLHGAEHQAQFMPKGMQDIGSQMHRNASRFAIAAKDADVTGDLKPALAALADVTAQCVGCHAGYRLK